MIMTKYKLNKTAKGKTFEYTVSDERGRIISKRTSSRDYVACTIDGSYYFGRLELVGRGDHGRNLARISDLLAHSETQPAAYVEYLKEKKTCLESICYIFINNN